MEKGESMSPSVYDVGDLVRVAGAFADSDDDDIDPIVVTFKFTDPSANTISYTYSTDPELKKESQGHYYVDISIDEAGTWFYRWESTGAVGQAAEENHFVVRESQIAPES